MGSDLLKKNIERLIEHWKAQGLWLETSSTYQIEVIEEDGKFKLPDDFREYYIAVNGMSSLETDNEGFLFYPVEGLVSFQREFRTRFIDRDKRNILIFADYLHKSWWYGFKPGANSNEYEIGIIPYKEKFKPITNSLAQFIELYLEDAPALYDYED